MDRRPTACAGLLSIILALASASAADDPVIIPRITEAPTIDGKISDACWAEAKQLTDFTRPASAERPAKGIRAWVAFDDHALYVAIECAEPHPDRLRARQPDGEQVWMDDCVEIWIRTGTDLAEFDQFIVNSRNKREAVRQRASNEPPPAEWHSAAMVGPHEWRVELAIPFRALGVQTPAPGTLHQIKIAREDHTSAEVGLATWPPGSSYAGSSGYAPAYYERNNLLRNAAFVARPDGGIDGWSFSDQDHRRFRAEGDAARGIIKLDAPGRYIAANQNLKLAPHSLYRLEALVSGDAGLYLRARVGGDGPPPTLWIDRSDAPVRRQLWFRTNAEGTALIIIGGTEGTGAGMVRIESLRLVAEVSSPSTGPALPVAADGKRVRVKKLLVADCRAVRGFISAPVDGTTESRGWDTQVWEYPQPGAGSGVGYHYRGNDGLHIALADSEGFDAIVLRGGVRAKVFVDCPSYESPAGGRLVVEFPGRTTVSRFYSSTRVRAKKVSLFDVGDGIIGDVSFLRVDLPGMRATPTRLLAIRENPAGPAPAELERRFAADDRRILGLHEGQRRHTVNAFELPRGRTVHLISKPIDKRTAIAAVGCEFVVPTEALPFSLAVSVQDPIDPSCDLFHAELEITAPKETGERSSTLNLLLDIPDQVIPAGTPFWLSLESSKDVRITGNGRPPHVALHEVRVQEASAEALAYRLLLLKGHLAEISEPRPWMNWYTEDSIEESLAGSYGRQLSQLRTAILFCREIAPDDGIANQYYEWVFRQLRSWRKERNRGIHLDASHALIDTVRGAPEWAVVARQAWLEARSVPAWWLANRLVPTGEFGGVLGDDTDMYQNYADFVMFESDGVAAELKDAAARLAELGERTTLLHGLNRATTDPLHAYEEGVNHESLMAWWFYGDPVYLERCMVAARSTEALTVLTPRGHRHFKSRECGAADLQMDRPTDIDGPDSALMMHPALEIAWYNGNPRASTLLTSWADGWLEHMTPGAYATCVEVASESVTATTEVPMYGAYGGQGSAFEFLYWITGDERYIGPFLAHYDSGKANTSPGNILGELVHRRGILPWGATLEKVARGDAAAALAAFGNSAPLVDALKRDIAELQNYGHMYTAAEVFTDRVFLNAVTNATMAYTGGFATRNKLSHTHAISYEGYGTEYAALVRSAGRERFEALLYNFAARTLNGRVRFWTLDHGRYRFSVASVDSRGQRGRSISSQVIDIARGEPITLALPARTTVSLEATLLKRADDLRTRADLALSRLDTRVSGTRLNGMAHNIGSRGVRDVEIVLCDAAGRVRDRLRIESLEAPLDLEPKRHEYSFADLPADVSGWEVRIDPDDRTPEICESNNMIRLPLD